MPTQTVSGTTLSYQQAGEGLPIVLLHGFPLDGRVWAAQLSGLSDRFRVIAPDLRGFGKSTSDDAFTMESIADDVHALLNAIGALPCVLGGLSMGGYAALAYARKYPLDLKGLLLIDTRAEAESPQGKEGRQKIIDLVRSTGASAIARLMMPKMLAADAEKARPGITRELCDIMESCPPKTIENALVAMRDRPDQTAHFPLIKTPTLIIVGESDTITPPAAAEAMQKGIAGSRLVLIKGAGHMTPTEQPEHVNRAIGDFAAALA